MKIGVIGLGAMGAPMARNFSAQNQLATVWNRTLSVAQAFSAQTGVSISDSVVGLAEQCDLILLSVSADADVLELVEQLLPGLSAGDIVIDTSTVSMETAQQVGNQCAARGIGFLDAPVSGGVEGAQKGTLAMMVGGEEATLERVRPALSAIAGKVVYMGPIGAGQATKAVNQIMAAGINQAVTEALSFGEAMSLPAEKLIDVVGSGAAGNWFLSHRGQSMMNGVYKPGFKLALHHKDLKICQQMADARHTHLPIVEMTLIHYQRLLDAGYSDQDISILYKQKKELWVK